MKKYLALFAGLLSICFYNCGQKKNDETGKGFFPVLSYLQSQVKHVDTSLYSIMRIMIKGDTSDTIFIKRENFRALAKDFLDVPDLTEKKYTELYTETRFFDGSLNRIIITYSPKNEDLEIRREEVQIIHDESGADRVKSIIIDKFVPGKDSSLQKRLLWDVDESFQVISILQKPNQPETTEIMKVIWNRL